MTVEEKAGELIGRLFRACQKLPDWGGNLWQRGQSAIARKIGVRIWLSKFKPGELIKEEEAPETEVRVTSVEERK
jgi:hypothetical protein